MKVTSTKTSRKVSGAGIIVVKGGGKQRTFPYDHALSPEANHGQSVARFCNLNSLKVDDRKCTVTGTAGKAVFDLHVIG